MIGIKRLKEIIVQEEKKLQLMEDSNTKIFQHLLSWMEFDNDNQVTLPDFIVRFKKFMKEREDGILERRKTDEG